MKLILILLSAIILSNCFGQQNTPDVLASGGDYFTNVNGSLSWTLGEMSIETIKDPNNTLTQGFQQSHFNVVSVSNLNDVNEFMAFPNPTSDNVTLRAFQIGDVLMELFDMQGRIILTRYFVGQNEFNINMNDLSTGLYLIKLTALNNNQSRIFKIQKI